MKAIAALVLTVCFAGITYAAPNDLLDMADKLDRLDRQDFQGAIESAEGCTRARNFACTEAALAKATKLAGSAKDRDRLAIARQGLSTERIRVEEEERERRRREEERRQREMERQAEEERAYRREQEFDRRRQLDAQSRRNVERERSAREARIAENDRRRREISDQQQRDLRQFQEDNRRRDAKAHADFLARREAEARETERRLQTLRNNEKQQLAQANTQRADAERARLERERQREQERAREERERERLAALEKQKQIDDEARRRKQEEEARRRLLAEQAATKQREDKERAERDKRIQQENYLQAMTQGIRLNSRSCPGDKGLHYIVGIRPRIQPEMYSCIDVDYTAICPGNTSGPSGVVRTFVGAGTDCYMGDAARISPTPVCKPEEVRVVVNRVTPGCR
jgi:hypothetical protein